MSPNIIFFKKLNCEHVEPVVRDKVQLFDL